MLPPVALLIFNRPDSTAKVFAEIARAKPERLLVIADGARSEEEAERCAAARQIVGQVDWPCEVLTNFSEVNLGCKRRVASGLNWVFENCEQAIILEDDCLPHPAFFRYCAELLEKYKDDERLMMISGNNFQFGQRRGDFSYYFSYYAHIWGWASWRRAWQHYDLQMSRWQDVRSTTWLDEFLGNRAAAEHWQVVLDKCFAGEIDTWDLQWVLTCWLHNGLTILPNCNLVSNIGFDAQATHTKHDIYGVANLSTQELSFPLRHPREIVRNKEADDFTFTNMFAKEFDKPSLYRRVGHKLLAVLPEAMRHSIHSIRAKQR